MKPLPFILLIFACLLPGCQAQDTSQLPTSLPPIQVYFSPKGGCTEAVVKELGNAKSNFVGFGHSTTEQEFRDGNAT